MTMQSVFSHTLAFMRKQGGPSMNEDGGCRYRLQVGEQVSHCAVGCNAPTLNYHENQNYDGQPMLVRDALTLLIPDCSDPDIFWGKLQDCHDSPANTLEGDPEFQALWVRDFERYMQAFAKRFKLEFK